MVLIGFVLVFLVANFVWLVMRQPADRCTAADRTNSNCVPAGRCTPPGDPREATIDCDIKNYDHKFDTNK